MKAAFIALALCMASAQAADVYRCANTYQDFPCAGGKKLDIDPNTNMIGSADGVYSAIGAYQSEDRANGPYVATIPDLTKNRMVPSPSVSTPSYTPWPWPDYPLYPYPIHPRPRHHRRHR